FRDKHPDAVANLLVGQVAANDLVARPSAQIEKDAYAAMKAVTGVTISQAAADLSWLHMTFTDDPLTAAVATDAAHAVALGQLALPPTAELFDLGPLNSILKAA